MDKIMHHYLIDGNSYKRLEEEYIRYGRLVICVDYDDTIYDFHKKRYNYEMVINLLRRWKPYAEIIVFTGRNESDYNEIHEYMSENKIPYDGINIDSYVVRKGLVKKGRKVYANVYIDDRAGLMQVYRDLTCLIDKIESGEIPSLRRR